jgi:hypothetical protein
MTEAEYEKKKDETFYVRHGCIEGNCQHERSVECLFAAFDAGYALRFEAPEVVALVDELARTRRALDMLYCFNDAAREAVVKVYGTTHGQALENFTAAREKARGGE